jgi:hypothetical protein
VHPIIDHIQHMKIINIGGSFNYSLLKIFVFLTLCFWDGEISLVIFLFYHFNEVVTSIYDEKWGYYYFCVKTMEIIHNTTTNNI